jgi:hypothetical protein
MRRPKWVERVLFGSPQACVAALSEAFRTVSLEKLSEKGFEQYSECELDSSTEDARSRKGIFDSS